MAQQTLKMMDTVGGSLLATKAVGEKPSVFKTNDIALLLDRQLPSKMGDKKLGEGDSEVALPSAGTLFGDASDMPAVDSQVYHKTIKLRAIKLGNMIHRIEP